jgi:hypothetical protein
MFLINSISAILSSSGATYLKVQAKNKSSPNLKVHIVCGLLEKKFLKIFKSNTVFKIETQKKELTMLNYHEKQRRYL